MKNRALGATGLMVSEIGLGCEDCGALWDDQSYAKPLLNMDPERERLYETCQRRGVGITVMKAFGGGDLLSADSPAGRALTVSQCIHYALTRPAVAAVMSGIHSAAKLTASLAYETATAAERDYAAAFATFPKISWQGHCMYCGHCAPCPEGIEVAAVTKFLNLARAQGEVPETVGSITPRSPARTSWSSSAASWQRASRRSCACSSGWTGRSTAMRSFCIPANRSCGDKGLSAGKNKAPGPARRLLCGTR